MKPPRIRGAVALVTGANRGIGKALTEALLDRGARKVYATARDTNALRGLRDPRIVPLRLDVTDADQIRAVALSVPDVELVFNNAGVALAKGLADGAVLRAPPAGAAAGTDAGERTGAARWSTSPRSPA